MGSAHPQGRARSERRSALLLLGLYLLCVVALPGLHLLFHEDDHDHEGGGMRLHRHAPPRSVEAGQPHDPDEHRDDGAAPHHDPEEEEEEGAHGQGALAHLCLVWQSAPPLLLGPPLLPLAPIAPPSPPARPLLRLAQGEQRIRGPPAPCAS